MTIGAIERELTYKESAALDAPFAARPPVQVWITAALVCLGYFIGTKIGFALTFKPHPISTLWPPNAILLAALVLTAPRFWWLLVLAAFPAHLAGQIQTGVPAIQIMAWFVSNCSEALIGAGCICAILRGPLRFDSFRHVGTFVACGAIVAPFVSSFIDVAFVTRIGWGQGSYWELWRTRFFSNVLASLTLVPLIVTWVIHGPAAIRRAGIQRYFETGLLTFGLLAVSVAVFVGHSFATTSDPVLLYAPVPFLLWAAVRLGPLGVTTLLSVMVFAAIWGVVHGYGPFSTTSPAGSALSVQLFLIVVSIPLLLLAAVIEEGGQTEAALRTSEERFARAFRSSPTAMIITRQADGLIIDVNDRWQALFGFTRAEWLGRTVVELGFFPNEEERAKLVERVRAEGRIRDVELDLHAKSGAILQTIVSSEHTEMNGEPCCISVIRDVTEERRIEREAQDQRRQMTHLNRVAALGQLSGALAHELNQPLTAILSNAQAAQRFLAREPIDLDELRAILSDIVDDDKRAGEVIRRLRALLKRGETQFQALDVNEIVTEALELAHGDLVAHNVTVATRFASPLSLVRGDRVQLQQVLLNLIVNASEAMNGNESAERTLTIATASDSAASILISVADRGHGIPEDRRDKLFEPFYTTKTHGLGLGLSISRSIITAHGGWLSAENNADRGATFRLVFPASAEVPS
jgi:two-component system, LuxR family, sensor kinase FixL